MSLPPLNFTPSEAASVAVALSQNEHVLSRSDARCADADAEQLGGSVVSKHLDPAPGAPTFAYLRDPAGNMFGVFTPPAT